MRIILKISIIVSSIIYCTSFSLFALYISLSLITWHKHRPSELNQVNYSFVTLNNDVYFCGDDFVAKYDYDSPNKFKYMNFADNGNKLNYPKALCDNNYIYVFSFSSYRNQPEVIQIYDCSFSLIKTVYFRGIRDIAVSNGKVFMVLKDDETNKYQLSLFTVSDNKKEILIDDIVGGLDFFYEDIHLYLDRELKLSSCLRLIEEKTLLFNFYDGNGLLHKRVSNYDLEFADGRVCVYVDDDSFILKPDISFNAVYKNAFLVDNKLVFSVYNIVPNKECGTMTEKSFCICKQGKSYAYYFDLVTKQFELIKEFNEGSFLVDYSYNETMYYYDGGLYVNNTKVRECEIITPGDIEKSVGSSYFKDYDYKLKYYLSYFGGNFYGI